MRKYERRQKAKVDRVLLDLRDERDHLSIRISLLTDREPVDVAELTAMQRNLALLDNRIARQLSLPEMHGLDPVPVR